MPENKTRKKYPGNFLRKNLREKIRRKNSTSRSRKNKPGKIKPRTQGRKIKAKNPGKIQGENQGLFQKPLQGDHSKGPENKAQPDSPQGRLIHRAHTAHQHRAGQEARAPGAQPTHTAQRPGHQQAGQPRHQGRSTQGKRESAAATHAARTAQGGQGSKASSTPASDERCDSMHHLHVI